MEGVDLRWWKKGESETLKSQSNSILSLAWSDPPSLSLLSALVHDENSHDAKGCISIV